MASIRQIAQDILPDARDGIAWIALYKKGRSWYAECFWGLYDDQTGVFSTDYPGDAEQLSEILGTDPNAIFVNPWYDNLGPIDDEMTRDTLANALRWQYAMQYSRLADASIVLLTEPEPDSSAETTETSGRSAAPSAAREDFILVPPCCYKLRKSPSRDIRNSQVSPGELPQFLTGTPLQDTRQRPPPTAVNPILGRSV